MTEKSKPDPKLNPKPAPDSSADAREKFLRFFESRGHRRVASSPLVPADDPTLLFTNSGMVQFKDVFLGFDKRPYDRAVTAQRCLRAGGKHNDLENVGYTARHHTFFEMLGNFSFGDYFKEQAIPFAWEFLTSPDGLGLAREHLWVTVFGGGKLFGPDAPSVPADDDAAAIWEKTLTAAGFSPDDARRRIARIPTSDNFWMMGETGPCGPCSEIFYNRDPNATRFEGEDEDRADDCVEVWNLVFMQFNRDDSGVLNPLPAPCVDTGMGLERISAVLQNVKSNFDIDSFAALNAAVNDAVVAAGGADCGGTFSPSHRVVADHVRAAAFLVADGVFPSNEGRGYVLRRIIRRALRHGHKLGASGAFFHKIVPAVSSAMGAAHPVIAERERVVVSELAREENNFAGALARGMGILKNEIARAEGGVVSGDAAFALYDTYGFPADLTADVAREHGLSVDMAAFEKNMSEQRKRSRAAMKFNVGQKTAEYDGAATEFVGYDSLCAEAKVLALFSAGGESAKEIRAGEEALVVLDRTPFYAESGGQVGDSGILFGGGGGGVKISVSDAQKIRADVWGHSAKVQTGAICVGDVLQCEVDAARRADIARAHSATHLMHSALRTVLGDHVEQRGSLVEAGRLRFDFSHNAAATAEELREAEKIVNAQIRRNAETQTETLTYDDALSRGATALFGEKYGDIVRMVTIGADYSVELCGGTHATRAGDVGLFRFVGESAVAAGVRRVEAVVGESAVEFSQTREAMLVRAAAELKSPPEKLAERISQMREEMKIARRELEKTQSAQVGAKAGELAATAEDVGGAKVVVARVAGMEMKALRELATELRGRLGSPCAIFLAGDGALAAAVDKAFSAKRDAREWMRVAAAEAGAKGGGRPDFAQAGGAQSDKLESALRAAREWIQSQN